MRGKPVSLKDAWHHYYNHFGEKDQQHAFYMGCLAMLAMSQQRSTAQLKKLARELDGFMRDDPCVCEECQQRIEDGTMPSFADRLFGETA